MDQETIPAGGGRGVLVRAGYEGECVQLALLSVHGKIIEAVTLEPAQLPALVGALNRAQGAADRDLMAALARKEREAKKSSKAALARNPWLTGKANPNDRYRVRPR